MSTPALGNMKSQRCILVHVALPSADADEHIELQTLALSAGLDVVLMMRTRRHVPDARFFCGPGFAETLRHYVADSCAEVVIFSHELSPRHQRNLSRLCDIPVLDKTTLILDIFAQRARTFEGKLQVELAQLQHMSTRLVRVWTHLERQKGGIGLRGPGEKQIETDRRLIRARIRHIESRLSKVERQREQGRKSRQHSTVPTVALVGYTNAGKSTLFNQLCAANVYQADQLFATLDPTLRRCKLPGFGHAVLADTVGFIRGLPHSLVKAFRATLSEVIDADLLLHVIDSTHPQQQAMIQAVHEVLVEIGAQAIPLLYVYNKIDNHHEKLSPQIERDAKGKPFAVWASAATGLGLAELREAIASMLTQHYVHKELHLGPEEGRLHAQLHALQCVQEERIDASGGWSMTILIDQGNWHSLCAQRKSHCTST